jgi:hypothetical protein
MHLENFVDTGSLVDNEVGERADDIAPLACADTQGSYETKENK